MLLIAAILNWYTSWLLVQMSRATGVECYEVAFHHLSTPDCLREHHFH
jgi:hypothetical protein